MEKEQKPEVKKSNWTKFIEAIIDTFKDSDGKGSATRMTIFTCLSAMLYQMIAEQSFGKKANMEIFGYNYGLVITGLGLTGALILFLEALTKFVVAVRSKPESKTEKPEEGKQ